jgi:hypothetical protein
MKIEELFKKVEKFFNMDKEKQVKKYDKRDKLKLSLNKKILSIKSKIKETVNSDKKAELKREMKALKKLKIKIKSV